jgi:hypothetical protein
MAEYDTTDLRRRIDYLEGRNRTLQAYEQARYSPNGTLDQIELSWLLNSELEKALLRIATLQEALTRLEAPIAEMPNTPAFESRQQVANACLALIREALG